MGKLYEDKIKEISEGEAAYALREGWKKLHGEYPSNDSLALLWAQWALETGRGKAIHCYNFGNIKRSGDEDYCMYRCNEIINGKTLWFDPPHKQTWFRAYPSAVEGAYDYIRFLSQRSRYQKAWAAIQKGNPALFAHELKVAGYYTANEAQYTKGVMSLSNEFKQKADEILTWKPNQDEIPTVPPSQPEVTPLVEIPPPPPLPQIDPSSPPPEEITPIEQKKVSYKFC